MEKIIIKLDKIKERKVWARPTKFEKNKKVYRRNKRIIINLDEHVEG